MRAFPRKLFNIN